MSMGLIRLAFDDPRMDRMSWATRPPHNSKENAHEKKGRNRRSRCRFYLFIHRNVYFCLLGRIDKDWLFRQSRVSVWY